MANQDNNRTTGKQDALRPQPQQQEQGRDAKQPGAQKMQEGGGKTGRRDQDPMRQH